MAHVGTPPVSGVDSRTTPLLDISSGRGQSDLAIERCQIRLRTSARPRFSRLLSAWVRSAYLDSAVMLSSRPRTVSGNIWPSTIFWIMDTEEEYSHVSCGVGLIQTIRS